MPQQRVNPTRMELLRLKKRTTLAAKGHKLLKEKRDGLMQEFLSRIREVRDLRAKVDKLLGEALWHFTLAQASMDPQAVRLLALLQSKQVQVDFAEKSVMGVHIPIFSWEAQDQELQYIWWETAPELDMAMDQFREVLPLLLELAHKEKAVELLAEEIEKTRRRVNALEHVLIPQLKETIRFIRMKLEEQGRAVIVTTMKVKQEIA